MLASAHLSDRAALHRILRCTRWKLSAHGNCGEALPHLRQHRVPVAISDAELAQSGWKCILEGIAGLPDRPMLIVSSRLADERLWAEVLNLGGWDVLATPFQPDEVLRVSLHAWQFWEHENRPADLQPKACL
jgi:DNA-binding NtrC family response regulator